MPLLSDASFAALGVPWQYFALSLVICLVCSALGFKRVQYFVSLGYASSIAAQAIFMSLLHGSSLRNWALMQSLLLLAYGLRLGLFLSLREKLPSYQTEQAETAARGAGTTGMAKVAMWLGVSFLYVLMFLPALLTMSAQAAGQTLPSIPLGVAFMVFGLGFEATADYQKSRFKNENPTKFCSLGLFSVVRFPNYFGELVFWFGLWISAISSFQSVPGWLLGSLGFICIAFVMLGSSRRLELKQSRRYGTDAAFRAYVGQTPILFPFLPIYSLQRSKAFAG